MGERLRQLRKERGLSVVELARRAGVSRSYIHLIESGGRQGRGAILAQIADALDTTVDYLLGSERTDEGLPIPEPDIARIVARLNELSPALRAVMVGVIDAVLEFGEARARDFSSTGVVDVQFLHQLFAGMPRGEKRYWRTQLEDRIEDEQPQETAGRISAEIHSDSQERVAKTG